jgi:hypothetical protein
MGVKVKENIENMMFAEDIGSLQTDEDIQLCIMQRFNIDAETLLSMPACKEPLHSLLYPEKRR